MTDCRSKLAKASAEYAKELKAVQHQKTPTKKRLEHVKECKKKLDKVKREYLGKKS